MALSGMRYALVPINPITLYTSSQLAATPTVSTTRGIPHFHRTPGKFVYASRLNNAKEWWGRVFSSSTHMDRNTINNDDTCTANGTPTSDGNGYSKDGLTSTEANSSNDAIKYRYDGVAARAEIKINALNTALEIANQSRDLHYNSKRNPSTTSTSQDYKFHWKQDEIQLSDAYSKAIKYTARLRSKDVAMTAQALLDDMIQRHASIQETSNFLTFHDGPQFSDRSVMDLVEAIEAEFGFRWSSPTSPSLREKENVALETTRDGIPVPTSKDFANVLHSWASSKVRRKGLYAESILYRMMELSYFYPENFEMPDSKMFGLVIKCYAGSTCTSFCEYYFVCDYSSEIQLHKLTHSSEYRILAPQSKIHCTG
jgi:hypothetical protein